jgi:methylaspartate ammonia-lyase
MNIARVIALPITGAYYVEDLAALQSKPTPMAERYTAAPLTPGFRHVRELAEGVSVGFGLDDGRVAWGDCIAVAYSSKAGRDSVFRAAEGLATIERTVGPAFEGREISTFREMAQVLEDLHETVEEERPLIQPEGMTRRDLLTVPARLWQAAQEEEESAPAGRETRPTKRVTVERQLHTAVRYGASQALLRAAALARRATMAELVAEEWGLPRPNAPVPIHAQCGADRYAGADKMIVRRVASLPHALVDDVPEQLGPDGSQLTRYARWLKERIRELGGPDYRPTIHLDVHGALGHIFDDDLGHVLGQLYALEQAVQPYTLRVESPVILDSREAQIEAMKALRDYVHFRQMEVQLVADEWANTLDDIRAFVEAQAADMIQIKMPDLGGVDNAIEAVLACQAQGVDAFLGGSCAETVSAAQIAVHVALATRPGILMAKPGMGVDEAISLTQNEMARTLAEVQTES